jgi:hypothetical protein
MVSTSQLCARFRVPLLLDLPEAKVVPAVAAVPADATQCAAVAGGEEWWQMRPGELTR